MSERYKIFIVDDAPVMLDALTKALGELYDITVITDPRIAIDKIPEENPDLVICDVAMPHMNGYEVLDTVRKRDYKGPFIGTSVEDYEDLRKLWKIKGAYFISKNGTIDEWLTLIEEAIKSYRS